MDPWRSEDLRLLQWVDSFHFGTAGVRGGVQGEDHFQARAGRESPEA
ncbi:hypothetical protein IMZ48_25315 [Candidatus Bathyarchaeota archaeon]|nr:hypothetical protein [Candidatus Bathyarchaeota archaeon]